MHELTLCRAQPCAWSPVQFLLSVSSGSSTVCPCHSSLRVTHMEGHQIPLKVTWAEQVADLIWSSRPGPFSKTKVDWSRGPVCLPKPIPVSGQTARWYLSASYMARGGHVAKSGQLKVDKRDKPMKSSGGDVLSPLLAWSSQLWCLGGHELKVAASQGDRSLSLQIFACRRALPCGWEHPVWAWIALSH